MEFRKNIYIAYLSLVALPFLWEFFAPVTHQQLNNPDLYFWLPIPFFLSLGLMGILGWRLNQKRILIASFFQSIIYFILFNPSTLDLWGLSQKEICQIFSLGFPLSLALIFRLKENRWTNALNFLKLVLVILPVPLLMIWQTTATNEFKLLTEWEITSLPFNLGFPQFAIIGSIIFLLETLSYEDKRIKPYVIANCIGQIPFLFLIHLITTSTHSPPNSSIIPIMALAAICGIQLHTIFRMYWQRVYLDELTNISNRRALDEYLRGLHGEYAIAMIDIDHFKSFNDTYGHDEGDNVLQMVAETLDSELGQKVYRYGGEEFCAVFEGVNGEDAYPWANKVRRKLEAQKYSNRSPIKSRKSNKSNSSKSRSKRKRKIQVTVSIGLASPENDSQNPEEVIKLADQALYNAKDHGRNCVIIWEKHKKPKKKK